jgi:hypothetical protein
MIADCSEVNNIPNNLKGHPVMNINPRFIPLSRLAG